MNPSSESNPETLETQIVVIGGGGGGLAAAVAAAEQGADVILLEKQAKPGGATAMAYGLFAAESPVQKRLNIDIDKDELFRIAMDFSHWSINPRLVRNYINKSGDTIRWLEEKGITFDLSPVTRKYGNIEVPRVYHYPHGFMASVVKEFIKNCEDLGVRVMSKTEAKKILTRGKNGVTGVLATSKGRDIKIKAKSVIIGTGGFTGNKELTKKWCPYYRDNWQFVGYPNMGDGISMALRIGAATDGLGRLFFRSKGTERKELSHPGNRWPRAMLIFQWQIDTIWVNKRGERYIDESSNRERSVGVMAILRQPDNTDFTLFDEAKFQRLIALQPTTKDHYLTLTSFKQPYMTAEEAKKMLQENAEKTDTVKISNSWDEIAKWMGITSEKLRATVDEYNSFCDKGHDEFFAKDPQHLIPLRTPPYYAIRCVPYYDAIIGGIKINHNIEVVDKEDNPILGLYAVGNDAGGYEGEVYNILLAGSFVGFALNSGRMAGENAAKYVQGK